MVGRKFVKIMINKPIIDGKRWEEIAIPLEDIVRVRIKYYNDIENIVYVTVKKNRREYEDEKFSEMVQSSLDCVNDWLEMRTFEV